MSSKRSAFIEEEFDDDTDLPLPSQPLPNTGARGPLLQELDDSDDEGRAGPASSQFRHTYPKPQGTQITDITPYKKWTCIYPIYIDAKRPYGTGERRISRAKSVWWPLSADIADATSRLGLRQVLEIPKAHPRDWENPGRVRVLWKEDGRLLNSSIRTKKQLLEAIAFQIQMLKPENIPKQPYNYVSAPQSSSPPPTSSSNSKGKAPATQKSKTPTTPQAMNSSRRRLPLPPVPYPPLNARVSPYSPAISTGVLIETVKAGMNAQQEAAQPGTPGAGAAGGAGAGAPGGMKGKRKVVRVRA